VCVSSVYSIGNAVVSHRGPRWTSRAPASCSLPPNKVSLSLSLSLSFKASLAVPIAPHQRVKHVTLPTALASLARLVPRFTAMSFPSRLPPLRAPGSAPGRRAWGVLSLSRQPSMLLICSVLLFRGALAVGVATVPRTCVRRPDRVYHGPPALQPGRTCDMHLRRRSCRAGSLRPDVVDGCRDAAPARSLL